jgi:hypothetical protein
MILKAVEKGDDRYAKAYVDTRSSFRTLRMCDLKDWHLQRRQITIPKTSCGSPTCNATVSVQIVIEELLLTR